MKKELTLQAPILGNLKTAFHSYAESYASIMSLFLGEKKILKVCGLKKNPYLCTDLHIEQADSTANIAVGIFYAYGLSYSSVPCGALMRPLPVQGGDQRGAELFLFLPCINQHIVSF